MYKIRRGNNVQSYRTRKEDDILLRVSTVEMGGRWPKACRFRRLSVVVSEGNAGVLISRDAEVNRQRSCPGDGSGVTAGSKECQACQLSEALWRGGP
jgi:hypothetical protein